MMTNARPPLNLNDYKRIAGRRASFILVPFFILGLCAIGIVLSLPAVYRSTGKIAVESQQVPASLVQSTVLGSADERISVVQQLIMTDTKLSELIAKFDLYKEDRDVIPMEKVLDKLRDNITVEAVRDPYSGARTAIAFTVSFDHTDPTKARDVAAELVELFLSENARTRNVRASDAVQFLTGEADRLRQRTQELEARVAQFKRENSDALPEHLDLRVNMLQQVEFDLREVQREISAAEQERRFLETQRNSIGYLIPSPQGTATTELTPEQQLRALRSDLAKSMGLYTQSHPDVVRLKRMVASLESQLGTQRDATTESPIASERDPERTELDSRLSTVDTKLSSLRTQENDLRDKMEALQSQIFKTPEVERGLAQLNFEYENAVNEFESIRSKKQQADLAENLESQQMAERFVLLDAPSVPVAPEKPDRLKLLVMGLILALGAGGGTALAAEAMDNRIRDPQTLARLIEYRPLAVLPYIEHPGADRRQVIFKLTAWLVFFSLLAAASLIAAEHSDSLQHIVFQAINRISYY
jgi:polysaccharide chain length determinant protein (PEP-CTERM system associated)